MWFEEPTEITQEDWQQCDIRLRGQSPYYKQQVFSFNPVNINHWLKKVFFDDKKPNSITLHSTYKDNKFLDDEQIEVLESFKETDPYYYDVYCLGQWGVLGKTIFDARIVNDRLAFLQQSGHKSIKTGFFEYTESLRELKNIEFICENEGYICIYKDVENKVPYSIGGDTAGEGSDYFTAYVINNITMEMVASYRCQFDEDLYAKQIYCLGKYYNDALIGIEVNFSPYTMRYLANLNYNRLYYRKESEDSMTGKLKKVYGFQTDKKSRPYIIANAVKFVRENVNLINCPTLLDEMLTFVRNENGKPEAQEGCHDDCVMGFCITLYISEQQVSYVEEEKKVDSYKEMFYNDTRGRSYEEDGYY